jgi:hypothetical protein
MEAENILFIEDEKHYVGLQSFQSYRHIPFDHLTTQAGGA